MDNSPSSTRGGAPGLVDRWIGPGHWGPAAEEGGWAAGCAGGEHGRVLAIIDRVAVAHGDRRQTDRASHCADLTIAA